MYQCATYDFKALSKYCRLNRLMDMVQRTMLLSGARRVPSGPGLPCVQVSCLPALQLLYDIFLPGFADMPVEHMDMQAAFHMRMGPGFQSSEVHLKGCLHAGCIIGYSLGFMNLLHNIAVYGTLCKELGYAFRCILTLCSCCCSAMTSLLLHTSQHVFYDNQ